MIRKTAYVLVTLVVLCTGCAAPNPSVSSPDNFNVATSSTSVIAAHAETTITSNPTTTTAVEYTTTTSQGITTTAQVPTTPPTTSTTRRPTTTKKPTVTKSKTKRKTTTTTYEDSSKDIKIKMFTFDYESEDYQRVYDLVAKYCDDPDLEKYEVSKKRFSEGVDPKTGKWCVTGFYIYLNRYINGCKTENHYTLLLKREDGVYQTDTLSKYINLYDSDKVKAPRRPTEKELKAVLKSEKKRVQKSIDRQWPDAGYVVKEQEVECWYMIREDRNFFTVKTVYGRPDVGPYGAHGAMSADFEIKR